MNINIISLGKISVAEVREPNIILKTEQNALDLMAECQASHIIIQDYNIEKSFFDLSTKLAGAILQKFSNYRIKLAIVGDFSKYPSQTLKDFIYESNRLKNYLFVATTQEALDIWAKLDG
ncbi:MAG: DUF4180 domain-containing protein [Candidatus Paceibacterota bacterium]